MAGRKIPMLEEPNVATRPVATPYADPSASPNAFGAGVGKALQGLGGDIGQIAARESEKADAFAAEGLEEELYKRVRPLLYGKGGPGPDGTNQDRGFFLKEGEAALDTKPTLDQINKTMNEVAALAKNDRQRKAFLARAGSRVEGWSSSIDQYSTTQRRQFYNDRANGQAALAIDAIGTVYNNPAEIEKELRKAKPLLVLHWADTESLPVEQIEARWKAFEADALNRAMEGYVGADDGIGGLKYLNTPGVRERLGKYAAPLEAKLRPIMYRQQGEVLAEEIFQASFGQLPETPNAPAQGWAQDQLRNVVAERNWRPERVPGGQPVDLSRPVIKNADGSISTERTATLESDGKFYVIPTIVNGEQKTKEQAWALYKDGKNPAVGAFGSEEEANDYAAKRSAYIGRVRQGDTKGLPPEIFDAASAGLQRRMERWKAGYEADSTSLFTSARAIWESHGHSLGDIPEHLRQELIRRDEWHKLEAADKAWKQASRPDAEPPTMAQRRALVAFYRSLNNEPHKYDNWDEPKFFQEVGSQLHPNDYEQAGLALARSQGRPERLTVGLAPIMAMYERLGGSNGLFPNMYDPSKPDNKNIANWDQYDIDVYYEGARRIQEWLSDWHRDDQRNKGRAAPPQEEYQAFIDTLIAQGVDPDGGHFGLGKKTTRMRAQIEGKGFVPDDTKIPYAVRQEILTKWKERFDKGLLPTPVPTEDQVRKTYRDAYGEKPTRPASPGVDLDTIGGLVGP